MRSLIPVAVVLVSLPSVARANAWSWFGSSQEKVKAAPARPSTPMSFVVAPSLLVADAGAAPGVIGQFSMPASPGVPLYFTADFGPYFHTSFYGTSVAIATLVGMDYRFHIRKAKVRPLFGVNFGPTFGRRVVFAMLFRPGLDIPVARDIEINAEARFGVIASTFVFLPQFGVRFVL